MAGKNNCFSQLLTYSQIRVRVLKLRAQRDWFETGSLETPVTHEVKVINTHIVSGCAPPMGVHAKKNHFQWAVSLYAMDRSNEQTTDYIPSSLLLPSSWKDGT